MPIGRTWSASRCTAYPSDVGMRFGARARDRHFGHYGSHRYRRSDRVHGLMRSTPQAASFHNDAHDRSDASLEVLVPFSARLPRRALPGAATRTGDPASTVDRLRATSFALMPRGTTSPTQWRRPVCPCGFALTKLARSTLRGSTPRVLIETLRRLSRRVAASIRVARCGSCAGAFLRPAFRYPRGGSRGLVGPLSASRSFVVFRPVNVAGTKPVACHACDGIAFDAFSRRRSWGFRWPFAGLLPQAGEARAFPRPRTHVPLVGSSVAVF